MSTHDLEAAERCAWCGGPLPAPGERLAIVRSSDGITLMTCSTACLAALVADLAGRTRQPVSGRTN